ncbi:MAG: glycosyltransferase family 4 protein [Chloroflexi bacterium]|nr:glycosyltransferase family 4 protein [Chloroflexota bacterium]MYC01312.1 glycosyltransferase family 4 protein [Chloroflexota bacterium]
MTGRTGLEAVRIQHVLPYDPTQPGGVQTHTYALSRALDDAGHDSNVFAPSRPLRVSLGGTRADLALHPLDALALRRFLRQPHDLVHIQEPLLPAVGPLALLHPSPVPTVVTLHSAEIVAHRFYRWTAPLTRRLMRRADALICASPISHQTAVPAISHEPRIIYPCLDLAAFNAVTRDPEPNTILFVGRDEPRKGLTLLLRAFRQLPQAKLVIAGPVRDSTRQLADGRTTFLGPIPHEEIPLLMKSATCAAFPATGGEALGLVLIESMAAGVPLVASDIPGYRIATDNGDAALLSPPNDPDALAQNLLRLLDDAQLRERLANRGREAANRFDSHVIARQHLDLYQSLVPA